MNSLNISNGVADICAEGYFLPMSQITGCSVKINQGILPSQSIKANPDYMGMRHAIQKSALPLGCFWMRQPCGESAERGRGLSQSSRLLKVDESWWDLLGMGKDHACRFSWRNPEWRNASSADVPSVWLMGFLLFYLVAFNSLSFPFFLIFSS